MSCPFIHDNIAKLYNTPPCKIEELPKVCTCGAPLTYADEVVFCQVLPPTYDSDVVKVEEVYLKWEPAVDKP